MAKREPLPMPDDILRMIEDRGVMDDYRERPYYQRNDYLGWIGRAKRPSTRERRIRQMLEELEIGGIYMGMDHPPSRKSATRE